MRTHLALEQLGRARLACGSIQGASGRVGLRRQRLEQAGGRDNLERGHPCKVGGQHVTQDAAQTDRILGRPIAEEANSQHRKRR